MTKEEIMKLSNREVDCLILEKVFGYKMIEIKPYWYPIPVKCFYLSEGGHVQYTYDDNACNAIMFRNGEDASDGYAQAVPFYSADIAAAWEVIEKIKQEGIFLEVNTHSDYYNVEAWISQTESKFVSGKTAPEAICKAALLAMVD